jgi:hypothetical protein
MRDLVDLHCPQADVVRVVLDNLSTLSPAHFTKPSGAGSPPHLAPPGIPLHAQARQMTDMVEIEIGVLRGRCLDRRIDEKERSSHPLTPTQPKSHNHCTEVLAAQVHPGPAFDGAFSETIVDRLALDPAPRPI